MSEFLTEIKDDLRKERYLTIWRKYGTYIIIVSALLVTFGIGYNLWQKYKEGIYIKATDQIAETMFMQMSGENDKAIKKLGEIANDLPNNLAAIALIRQANLLANSGKIEESMKIYDKLRNDKKSPIEIRDMAALFYLNNQIDKASISGNAKEDATLITSISQLTDKKRPWHGLAKEMLAAYYVKLNNIQAAKTEYKKLTTDISMSAGIRARATEMLDILGK